MAEKTSPRRRGISPFRFRRSSGSFSSHDSKDRKSKRSSSVLVCHESARSIVFRDELRMAAKSFQEGIDDDEESDSSSIGSDDEEDSDIRRTMRANFRESMRESIRLNKDPPLAQEINQLARTLVPEFRDITLQVPFVSERNIEIEGFHAHVEPYPELELGPKAEFEPLLSSGKDGQVSDDWSEREKGVFLRLKQQKACVKTIKNSEWKTFLERFREAKPRPSNHYPSLHDDIPPEESNNIPFNSFVTSTSLLPELGLKMRAFGSLTAYTVGVVFPLPDFQNQKEEDEAANKTETWAWPAGYAAKTEFNVDRHGHLINGRKEALLPLSTMKQYNYDYVHKNDHMIAGKLIKGGFKVVPYNEVFLRVGGVCETSSTKDVSNRSASFERGVGLPAALFIRSVTMGDIIALFRAKARLGAILGKEHVLDIPLLFICPDLGVRVLTEPLQQQFWQLAADKLQPFQNHAIEPMTSFHDTHEKSLEQKLEELMDLDEKLASSLTFKQRARICGGWGVLDSSLSTFLQDPRLQDTHNGNEEHYNVGHFVREALKSAVRAGDYYVARQILILYAAQRSHKEKDIDVAWTFSDHTVLRSDIRETDSQLSLPPPLEVSRLVSATNLDGLLVVLGATQVLRGLHDDCARKRAIECSKALTEWVEYAERSVSFRLASWREQRAAEGDAQIAVADTSKFMAFVSNKAINNRKRFARLLEEAAMEDYTKTSFLRTMYKIIQSMNSPCLRLELMQFLLGLDNRFSVFLVKQCVELAATCIGISRNTVNGS